MSTGLPQAALENLRRNDFTVSAHLVPGGENKGHMSTMTRCIATLYISRIHCSRALYTRVPYGVKNAEPGDTLSKKKPTRERWGTWFYICWLAGPSQGVFVSLFEPSPSVVLISQDLVHHLGCDTREGGWRGRTKMYTGTLRRQRRLGHCGGGKGGVAGKNAEKQSHIPSCGCDLLKRNLACRFHGFTCTNSKMDSFSCCWS